MVHDLIRALSAMAQMLNPYGAAYQNDNGDLAVIETQDSDGDGFSDLDEVNALTFPGIRKIILETHQQFRLEQTKP